MNFPLIFPRPGLRTERSYSQVIAKKTNCILRKMRPLFQVKPVLVRGKIAFTYQQDNYD